jgi:hypothetical protein
MPTNFFENFIIGCKDVHFIFYSHKNTALSGTHSHISCTKILQKMPICKKTYLSGNYMLIYKPLPRYITEYNYTYVSVYKKAVSNDLILPVWMKSFFLRIFHSM